MATYTVLERNIKRSIDDLVDGAPVDKDTLNEIATIITTNQAAIAALQAAGGGADRGYDDWIIVDASASPTGDGSHATPYATITEALTSASDGDVIFVRKGTYTEALTIHNNTSLTKISIIGEDRDSVILQTNANFLNGPSSALGHAIYFKKENGELNLHNLTIRNCKYGLYTKAATSIGPRVQASYLRFTDCGASFSNHWDFDNNPPYPMTPCQVSKITVPQALTGTGLPAHDGVTITLGRPSGGDITFEIDIHDPAQITGGNVRLDLTGYTGSTNNSLDIAEGIAEQIRLHGDFGASASGNAVYIRNLSAGVISSSPSVTGGNFTISVEESGSDLATGWAQASNAGAIRVQNSVGSRFYNIEVDNCDRGFRIQDCTDTYILSPKIKNTLQAGIYLADSSYGATAGKGCIDTYIFGARSENNANNGLLIIGGRNNQIFNSSF